MPRSPVVGDTGGQFMRCPSRTRAPFLLTRLLLPDGSASRQDLADLGCVAGRPRGGAGIHYYVANRAVAFTGRSLSNCEHTIQVNCIAPVRGHRAVQRFYSANCRLTSIRTKRVADVAVFLLACRGHISGQLVGCAAGGPWLILPWALYQCAAGGSNKESGTCVSVK
jgi:NAD(P)-dependent dehydrogenase (short-subunit alcohol dehydrogenase family)